MIGFGSNSEHIPSLADAQRFQKAQEFLNRPRSSMIVKLKSGDQLSYSECGPGNGIPVLWLTGPTHNRFVIGLYESLAIELGIRLICFDRPGRGASTPLRYPKEWGFESWAVYIDEATDILGINKFFIVAHSHGTTYALASYNALQHKILGSLRFLAIWAPSNLPCMPTSYALQRSLPTGILRRMFSLNSTTSLMIQGCPTQMGSIGFREQDGAAEFHVKEILEFMQNEVATLDYPAYELDWLIALEKRKPFPFDHKSITCPVKCWHGMDDDVSPLGAAMWIQRQMNQFLLYAVEGATHNILYDFAIIKAVFSDIVAENLTINNPKIPETSVSSEKTEKKESNPIAPNQQSSSVDKGTPLHPDVVSNVWA